MFGYVRIRKPELKVKDYDTYHGFYCGLCNRLRDRYGLTGQVTLTYDMTFLVILLTSVYGAVVEKKEQRCILHPVKKHHMLISSMSDYAADMNMILSYYKFRDEWEDSGSAKGIIGMKLYRQQCRQLASKYPKQFRGIRHNLKRLQTMEKRGCDNVMDVADCFGRLMAGILRVKEDSFADYLGQLGYSLGRYIYIMDAYDDLRSDLASGDYNPFRNHWQETDFEEKVRQMLLDEMAMAGRAYEMLPCVEYNDILRNIIYAGVWNKYDDIQTLRKAKEGEIK